MLTENDGIHSRILDNMDLQVKKALDALDRYKFWMFGYHAANWVNLNHLLKGKGAQRNPFRFLVHAAWLRTAKRIWALADTDLWAEHIGYPVKDWQYEVSNGDTRLGYWEWCASKELEKEADERDRGRATRVPRKRTSV